VSDTPDNLASSGFNAAAPAGLPATARTGTLPGGRSVVPPATGTAARVVTCSDGCAGNSTGTVTVRRKTAPGTR